MVNVTEGKEATMTTTRKITFKSRTRNGERTMETDVLSVDGNYEKATTNVEIITTRKDATVRLHVHNCTVEEWEALPGAPDGYGTSVWKEVKVGNTELVVFAPAGYYKETIHQHDNDTTVFVANI